MHKTIEEKHEEIEKIKKESEEYNNQDMYVKYAKMQRSILKMSKMLETHKEEFLVRT